MKIAMCCSVVWLLLGGVSLAWPAGSEMTSAPMPLTPEDGSGAVALSTSDYILGPSDLLQIDVFQVDELSGTERINAAGYIKMPLIGLVKVAGLSREQSEDLITELYAEAYLQDPQVNIDIMEYVSHQITVLGHVTNPGVYPLKGKTTLLQALAMAGDAGALADEEEVVVFRSDESGVVVGYVVNLEDVLAGTTVDPEIIGNDKVVVPVSGSKSFIKGITDTLRGFVGFATF
ncbi:MAG: polysaccharide export protein [Halioglobus sp.]|nr:polysaccharide export protein [Halioglobus sp.]